MSNEFKVGDVVALKSGGPQMTVEETHYDQAWCVWFEGTKRNSTIFKFATLEKVEAGP